MICPSLESASPIAIAPPTGLWKRDRTFRIDARDVDADLACCSNRGAGDLARRRRRGHACEVPERHVQSSRLTFRPIGPDDIDDFSALVQDEHIRRYMMDGKVFPPSWSAEHIRESQVLFDRLGVGLWIVHLKQTAE